MAGQGRKLTGIPSGGFQDKVTKRWPFAQAVETKRPVYRGRGKPPPVGAAPTPSLAALARTPAQKQPVAEYVTKQPVPEYVPEQPVPEYVPQQPVPEYVPQQPVPEYVPQQHVPEHVPQQHVPEHVQHQPVHSFRHVSKPLPSGPAKVPPHQVRQPSVRSPSQTHLEVPTYQTPHPRRSMASHRNTGRKLTGYPIGGFEEKVTKRWPFAQAIETKKPPYRGKGKPPPVRGAPTPSLAALARTPAPKQPEPEYVTEQPVPEYIPDQPVPEYVREQQIPNYIPEQPVQSFNQEPIVPAKVPSHQVRQPSVRPPSKTYVAIPTYQEYQAMPRAGTPIITSRVPHGTPQQIHKEEPYPQEGQGRKLTGIPSGGFQDKVTKRWPFAQAVETKRPVYRGRGKPPPVGAAPTPSLAALARTPAQKQPVAEYVPQQPEPEYVPQQHVPEYVPQQHVPEHVPQQHVPEHVPQQHVPEHVPQQHVPEHVQHQPVQSFRQERVSIPLPREPAKVPPHQVRQPSVRSPSQTHLEVPTYQTPHPRRSLPRASTPITSRVSRGTPPEIHIEEPHPQEDVGKFGGPFGRHSLPMSLRPAHEPSISPHVRSLAAGLLKSGDSSIISMKRPSIVLPTLMEDEKYFHDLVKSEDIQPVQEFLNQRPDFNINCTNFQGVTALHIAVKSGNEELVHELLEHPEVDIGDSALHAIKDNNINVLKMILEKQRSVSPSLEYLACPNSAEFPDNITPLILAAISGHYEIIALLLDRGHIIPRPHKPRCFCKEECLPILQTQDPLSVSSGKLQIYRALSNPAYICNTTDDPILAAFKLSKELKVAGMVDTIFRNEYYELSEQTRIFAANLIGECRSAEEVEIILSDVPAGKISASYTFPRLILAMDYKQKEFVASPNVQQLLEVTWVGNWYTWKGYRKIVKILYVIPRLLMLPFILIVLIVMPNSNMAKFYALPINKLLSSVASYTVFLILVYIQSDVDKAGQTKESQPTGCSGCQNFEIEFSPDLKPRNLRGTPSSSYQVTMELLFLATFISWLAATMQASTSGNAGQERKFWKSSDPELIAEGLFVGACIMAFLRILLILQINYELGPLQVAIGKMTTDFAKYTLLMSIILLAFTAALCKFYSYYAGMVQKDPETGEESKQEDSFTSTLEAFKTLFWGIFGMAGPEAADVVIENLPDESGNNTEINEHHFTEAVGYIAFAVYTVLMVIVVVNMLIATMSNTFQRILDSVDSEWVFGKTEVYLQYINYPVLPPPFNLIPTTYGIKHCFTKSKDEYQAVPDPEKGILKEERGNEDFHVLMAQLVQRYFSKAKDEEGS